MGAWFTLLFAEEDIVHVKAIAKLHKVDKEIVEKYYKKMLEDIANEIQK